MGCVSEAQCYEAHLKYVSALDWKKTLKDFSIFHMLLIFFTGGINIMSHAKNVLLTPDAQSDAQSNAHIVT